MSTKKISEVVLSMILLIAGIALWFASQKIEVGAAMGQGGDFMPKLCSTVWVLISALLLIFNITMKDEGEKTEGINLKGFFATLILLFVYVFMLKPVGFVISSIVYMLIQMLLFVPAVYRTKKNYILFVVLSVIVPVAVNALFVNVFSLILPTGIL